MTIAEKLQTIADNEQAVYDAGYKQGMKDVPTQEKTVVPSAEIQEVLPDENYLLSKVIVKGAYLTKDFLTARNCDHLFYASYITNEQLASLIDYEVTSNATSMRSMFDSCYNLTEIPLFDTSNVTDMASMFCYCYYLTEIPLFDTSNVTDMASMFGSCSNLTEIPLFDTSNVTSMSYMFDSCYNLTEIPLFDTSNVTDMASMFGSCSNLTEIPLFDTSNVTSMSYMFSYCSNLTEIPLFDTSKVTNMSGMFIYCSSLTEIPLFDTSKVTNMSGMFNNCEALTKIAELDLGKLVFDSSANNIVKNCSALTECWFKNIKKNLTVGSGTTYGHLITLECLLHLIKECVKRSTPLKLTIGSANLAKLEGIYVKLIEVTDEMIAEDELIESKYPFEECKSTDEGALSLTSEYLQLKNLELA